MEGNSQSLGGVAIPVFQTAGKKSPQSKVHLFGGLYRLHFAFTFYVKVAFTINSGCVWTNIGR